MFIPFFPSRSLSVNRSASDFTQLGAGQGCFFYSKKVAIRVRANKTKHHFPPPGSAPRGPVSAALPLRATLSRASADGPARRRRGGFRGRAQLRRRAGPRSLQEPLPERPQGDPGEHPRLGRLSTHVLREREAADGASAPGLSGFSSRRLPSRSRARWRAPHVSARGVCAPLVRPYGIHAAFLET